MPFPLGGAVIRLHDIGDCTSQSWPALFSTGSQGSRRTAILALVDTIEKTSRIRNLPIEGIQDWFVGPWVSPRGRRENPDFADSPPARTAPARPIEERDCEDQEIRSRKDSPGPPDL